MNLFSRALGRTPAKKEDGSKSAKSTTSDVKEILHGIRVFVRPKPEALKTDKPSNASAESSQRPSPTEPWLIDINGAYRASYYLCDLSYPYVKHDIRYRSGSATRK